MRAEKVIFTLLTQDAGLTALVAGRIYPSRVPQNTVMPAIAYEVVSGIEITPISASAGYQVVNTRVQVTCMAQKYSDVKDVIEAARLACIYKSGTIGGVKVLSVLRDSVGPDSRADDLALFMQSIDFMVSHYEV